MRAAEIREKFLKYFEQQKHTRVASASLIPAADPTLYFTNAGMVPFKEVFLGTETRPCTRAASSQKCMRVSGKHNDLENVGYTPRHHTFFEMLGNFSFGDYFKKEAVAFAWEFLTEMLKLPKEKLYITVYEKDDEAAKLWEKHISKDRIFRLGEKDNFWAMGDTGPCGPCSEILWDFGKGKVTAKDLEGDRLFELWNLVFMQYNRSTDGTLHPLPKPSVDTGMGLERLACVLQGKESNWDTDLFIPIIEKIERIVNPSPSPLPQGEAVRRAHGTWGASGTVPRVREREQIVAMRVVADHVRAAAFLIADGLFPSNEGRGYVLRRILRRAIRYGRKLGMHKPFFAEIAHTVMDEMGNVYPELVQHQATIEKVLTNEEERFLETLDRGLAILEQEFNELKISGGNVIPGDVVFKLYDTFGFPKDLTELLARERLFSIDEKGFEGAMEGQRERARKAWKGSGAVKVSPIYQTYKEKGLHTKFVGHEKDVEKGEVLKLVEEEKEIAAAPAGKIVQLIVDKTPFYAEGGGQVGDTGVALKEGDIELKILDTQKPFPDLFIHRVKVVSGELTPKNILTLMIDRERREKIRKHHTATHLIHAALRRILGTHVKQAGSYLDDKYLRFDFSHFEALSDKQLSDIEALVNNVIQQNLPIKTEVMPRQEAIAKGAMAFFGEKYGDLVRVVEVPGFSIELCGGTHVATTGVIGLTKILKERSVASGVRRVEAVSGVLAQDWVSKQENRAEESKELEASKKIKMDRVRGERSSRLHAAIDAFDSLPTKEVQGVKVLAAQVSVADVGELREVADGYKQKLGSGIVTLGADTGGKAALVIMVTPDLVSKYSAGNLMKQLAPVVGGTGGGRPDMAQGGGPDTARLPDVFKRLKELL